MNYYLGLIFGLALVIGQVLTFRINEDDISVQEDLAFERSLSSKLYEYLDNLRYTLRKGDESHGIPPLEPYAKEELNLQLGYKQVKGSVKLTHLYVAGITNYTINKADVSIFKRKADIDLNWSEIRAQGEYGMDVEALGNTKVFGDGNFTLVLHDLSFSTTIKFGIIGGMKIKDIQSSIKLGAAKFTITGLFGDEEMSATVSKTISTIAPKLVAEHQDDITKAVNDIVIKLVNG